MHYLSTQGVPSLFLLLDVEKAFDLVDWRYMRLTLRAFGFMGQFMNGVRSLYTTPTARVINSGLASDYFSIKNGTRQGCPLSPFLFSLRMEPFAQKVRRTAEIKGIGLGATQFKISLFADDTLF